MLTDKDNNYTRTRAEKRDYIDVPWISREQFLENFGNDYEAGQHVTFIGPTRRGKTTFALQLLDKVISPELPCVIFAGKPPERDPVMTSAAKMLNLRIVEEWPPSWNYKDKKRNGYVLRPRQTLKDLNADNANVENQYRKALQGLYASKKPVIIVQDESAHIQVDMKLKKETEAPLQRGAPVVAVWCLLQRGKYVSYHVYAAPEHVFIFFDPDRTNQERYSEIGGLDPKLAVTISQNLKTARGKDGGTISECIYFKRSEPNRLVIIGMS